MTTHGEEPRQRRPASQTRRRPSEGVLRRRRLTALTGAIAMIVIVAVVALSLGGGGAVSKPPPPPPQSLVARIRVLAGSGQGSFAADRQLAEMQAINRTLTYTPYVRIAGSQHREIALTFDDGPGPYTPQVLAILEREHVPGTFFEVGVEEEYFHASTTAIVHDGFTIGDHTQEHAPMSELSEADQYDQLIQGARSLEQYGAPFPRLFRPPYGLWNDTTLSLLSKYHMLMVLWTVDTEDWERPGVQAIVKSAVKGAQPGAIILLHDAGGDRSETVSALPIIIRDLRIRGYRLVSVPQLLLDNPPPKQQNIAGLTGEGG